MDCPKCKTENTHKNGKAVKSGKQKYRCNDCGYNFEDGVAPKQIISKTKVGMTLDEFRNKHDIEHIITKTLDKLDKNLVYEKADLIKLSGLPYSAQGLGTILEAKNEYYGKTGGKVYYSHPDTIKILKAHAKLN